MTDALPIVPPYLYLPCAQAVSDPADAVVDLRNLSDGRTALLAYTALDRLLTCCGDAQPWLVVPAHLLPRLRQSYRWDVLLLDIEIPVHERRSAHDHRGTLSHQEAL
ncbi:MULTISPECIES: SAV_915 family protein [unclassified Rhodococcus (in: high G+C Gram-positive bacteria)]|uniref:SAV_915 family protein n=1 Tax=Rhodococcus sp. SJ-3 TaxID=3454628 RepID=UPI003F7ABCE6